jgi:glycosyltransferase involved in cell wall biosynthesis
MRILHVIPSVGPVRGGPTEAVLGTVRALNARGLCAEILTTNDNGVDLLDVPFGQCTEHAGVPVRFFPRFNPPFAMIREFAFSASLTRWLAQHLTDYDLVHVHAFFSYASTAAMLMARRKGIPYVVRPLGLLCGWSLRQSMWRKNAYLALVERSNLDHSAGLEYTAEQELREAEPLRLQAPGFVLPFGLHLPELCADARSQLRKSIKALDGEPVVLFLSRLHPKKGVHHLIEALETLAARRFSVVVAGSGPADYEAQIREQVTRGRLNGRVHFVGFAQGQTKQMLLQGADVFALTSHSESFAIAAMEAMAAGTPVLITPGVPLAPLVSKFDTGWVTALERSTIAAAAARALDSLSDQEARKSRSQRCRALAANFEWPRIAGRMRMVYEAVLEQRPLPSFQLADVTL